MRRKPILYHNITTKGHGKGRIVIGLIGTHHGVGVTHTALMLAFYHGEELGRRTALLECNRHQDMLLIQKAYEWKREDAFSFSFHQITCYKEVGRNQVAEIYGEDYESIILDFGIDFAGNREEFLRCGVKIVIGGRSEWDLQKLIQFAKASEDIRGSNSWLYFIPLAKEKTITRVSNEIKRRVRPVPDIEEPTVPSRNTNRFFETLF